MQKKIIKKIVIVGGGTAGWITANHLAKKLAKPNGIAISLIESPNIPTIGVGEGTVPAMRESLRYFGIDEGRQLGFDPNVNYKRPGRDKMSGPD